MVLTSQQKGVDVAVGEGEGASMQAAAPAALVVPAAQGAQVALEVAPVAVDQVPAGQGEHCEAPSLDHVPAGQGCGGVVLQ